MLGGCDRGTPAPQALGTGVAPAAATRGDAGHGASGQAGPDRGEPVRQVAARDDDPRIVRADDALLARLRIEAPTVGDVAEVIRVAGRIEVDQYRTARIGAPITGRITEISAVIGQQVARGQALAEINSPDLARAQLDFLRAHAQQQLLTRAVERAQLLLAADVIGSAELQRRQGELDVAIAEKRAAHDQLRTLGLSHARIERLQQSGQIQATATITATLPGTVIERNLALGQVVNPTDTLFLVSDLRSLWAAAEVPELDARFVRKGQRVEVEVPALDYRRVTGRVALVADVVNPDTRTVRVGVDLDNSDRSLKPSMLLTMLVEGRTRRAQRVPAGAIVRDGDRDHVFVEIGPGRFRLTPVAPGAESHGVRALAEPLPEGTRIVADGAFHLNNVRVQRAATAR
jgi:cobalt-zinc-cadmium efflux system membrane fusion protein